MPRNNSGMAKKRKTREEKIRSAYRLENFRLKAQEVRERKDVNEFEYLSSRYVRKDLLKTVILSAIMIGLLLLTKSRLG